MVLVGEGAQAYHRLHARQVAVANASLPAASPLTNSVDVDLVPDGDLQAAADELTELKSGISVTEWKQAHPEDQREAEARFEACAAFHWTKQLADGSTLTRMAAFYPPDPPSPLELPTNEDPASLISRCTLASIRVELEVNGREKLLRSVPRIQSEFTRRMGNPDPQLPSYGYPLGPPWHDGEASVIIEKNTDVNPLFASNAVSNTLKVRWQSHASLVTYAYLPKVLEEKQRRTGQPYEVVSPETSPEIFELAMRTAAIEQADLVKTMNELYQDCYQHPEPSGNDASYQQKRTTAGLERGQKVVDALALWLRLTRELPPQRRAGGLLAAYFLLKDSTTHLEDAEMEAMRDWLLEKKVIASENELGPWGATAKWVREARELDPEGPIGEAITLMTITTPQQMLELRPEGNRLVAESGGQKDVTDYVIEAGEKYLSKPRDPGIKELVEYFIASAYCDRIQLARTEDGDKPSSFEIQRAAAARPEAVKYFALAAASNSPRAVTAWRSGWRVLAGLPVGIRFYDVGD